MKDRVLCCISDSEGPQYFMLDVTVELNGTRRSADGV